MSKSKTPITDGLQRIIFEGCECVVSDPETLEKLETELNAANERAEKAIDSLERSGVDAKRWQERAEKYREIAKEFRRICNGVILMTDHIKEYDSSLDVLRNEEFTNAISKLEKLEEGK